MALSVGDVVSRCVRVSGRGLVGVELIYNSACLTGGRKRKAGSSLPTRRVSDFDKDV